MVDDGCRETGVLLGKLENIYNRAIEDRHYVGAARSVEIQARLAGSCRRSTSACATPPLFHPPPFTRRGRPALMTNRRYDDK